MAWGPCVWRALRWVAEGFPDEPTDADRDKYRAYFTSLGYVLPCEKCQHHYQQNMQKHPLDLSSREMLKLWLYEIYKESTRQPNFTYDAWLSKTADTGGASGADRNLLHITLAFAVGAAIGFGGAHYYAASRRASGTAAAGGGSASGTGASGTGASGTGASGGLRKWLGQ